MIKPGARIYKTTIAVFLSMVISLLFTHTPSAIAPISAVIVLRENTEVSIKQGVDRLIGTIIGSIVSIIYVYLFSKYIYINNPMFIIISTSILILITLWISKIIKLGSNSSSNAVVLIILVLNAYLNNTNLAIEFTLIRTFETAIGIICAVLVNHYIKIDDKATN